MTRPKFTPGPWTADERGQVWRVELRIADTVPRGIAHVAPPSERVGNRHLIAAAPDMYEALDRLLKLAEAKLDPDRKFLFHGEMVQARVALAKARGES